MEHLEELDIKKLVKIIYQSLSFVIVSTMLVGIAAFVYSETMVLPTYQSSISMYVNNNNRSTLISKSQISGADMQASQMLVETYITIIKSDTFMNEISRQLERRYGLEYSSGQILSMLSAHSVNDTEIFRVSITNTDPEHAAIIANVVADTAPDIISNFVEASTVKIIDRAKTGVRVSPNIPKNTVLGLLIGLLYSCAYIIIRELFDTRVKSEEDLERWFGKSILGIIPEIDNSDSSKNKYHYYRRSYRYGRGYSYRKNYGGGGSSNGKQQNNEFIKAAQNVTKGASKEN